MFRRLFVEPRKAGWLVGLDGLRALAVVAVVLYHFLPRTVIGGFLGVDLFFAISGFVITTLALREVYQRQRIDIKAFYRRRARRLLPALVALVMAVGVGSVTYWPDARPTFLPSALSGLFFSANWWLIAGQQSYFVESGRPPLLQHLWSLGVEEQFYLLWPILLTLLIGGGLWTWRRPVVLRPRSLRRFALAAFALGCLSSVAMAALAARGDVPYGDDSSRIYFGTDTHSMGLLFGSAAAALSYQSSLPGRRRRSVLRGAFVTDVIAIGGLAFVLRAMLRADEFSPELYRTGFAVYSMVAAVVVACVVRQRSAIGWLLERPFLAALGRRSYSIYLWHWPVATVTRPEVDVTWSPGTLLTVRLLATLVLAEFSYRVIEQPIRSGRAQAWCARHYARRPRRRLIRTIAPVTGLASLLIATSLGSAWAYSQPSAATNRDAQALPVSTQWPPSASPLAIGLMPGGLGAIPKTPASSSVGADGLQQAPQPATGSASAPLIASAVSPTPSPLPSATPLPLPVLRPIATPVSAFGDSVMLGAASALRVAMPNIDVHAVEGRQARAVFADVAATRARGQLAPLVVIHAGDNGVISPADLTATLASLSDRVKVVVLTDRVAKDWQDPNNRTIARICAQFANVAVGDWQGLSNGQPTWFYKDGLHVRPLGASQYAALVTQLLE